MSVRVKRKGDVLRIELPLRKPQPSNSGKSLLVASTFGVTPTNVRYEGGRIVVVANAFIYHKRNQ